MLLAASAARADTLVPGASEAGFDDALSAKASGFERQLHALITPSIGWGLEAFIDDPVNRTLVDDFIASGSDDFQATTGKHAYEVVDRYGEFHDVGMFGGVQAAGDAFRYAVLRDEGAPADEVERAREHLLAAMRGLHWYTQITGVPGTMARGIRRITPEAGEPPLPDVVPETVPLFDGQGQPMPGDKEPTWREDQSGELPFLIWLDDTSKDQVDGYIFALGAVYDVVADDPSIPTEAVDTLIQDALAIGRSLMQPRQVSSTFTADLVLMDADGRPTSFHDLSAEEAAPGVVLNEPLNGFNGLLGMGIMRTLFHITGDEEIGRFYRSLIEERGYLPVVLDTIDLMYTGANTNNSNINMAFVGIYNVMRYETDPAIAAELRGPILEKLYAPGEDREPRLIAQPLFDFIYAGFREGGTNDDGASALERGLGTLSGFRSAPYWDEAVVHCDEDELAAGSCVAEDGVTAIELERDLNWNEQPVATSPLPIELRPPSNFHWRTDPYLVNGGGSTRLNPGGGFHGAYWMGRFLARETGDLPNLSPHARDLPDPLPLEPEPEPTDPSATPSGDGGGCGCELAPSAPSGAWVWLASLGLALARRRRSPHDK